MLVVSRRGATCAEVRLGFNYFSSPPASSERVQRKENSVPSRRFGREEDRRLRGPSPRQKAEECAQQRWLFKGSNFSLGSTGKHCLILTLALNFLKRKLFNFFLLHLIIKYYI